MSRMNHDKTKSFFGGRGFYIALVLCLAVVGVAGYLALVQQAEVAREDRDTPVVQQEPVEDCGLIGGTIQNSTKSIEKVFYLTNTDNSPEHFSLDPQEQFAVVRELRSKGWSLLGNWHSHPSSPSRPNEEDKRLAFDPSASYLILSLAAADPVLHSFQVSKDKTVAEEMLELTE